jgi:DNA-directed RNA polymerase specialized sigma subunit
VMAISKDLGVTRSSIYQLEASALRELHNCLSDRE